MNRVALLPGISNALLKVPEGENVIAEVSYGFDGASSQVVANQKSRNEYDQAHRESAVVCVRELHTESGQKIWDNPHKNSDHGMRPWLQAAMTENRDSLEMIHTEFMDEEVRNANATKSVVPLSEDKTVSIAHNVKARLVDGKCVREVTGLGGCFCTKCLAPKKDAHNKECVLRGFPLNRDMEEMASLALSLVDTETGEIPR